MDPKVVPDLSIDLRAEAHLAQKHHIEHLRGQSYTCFTCTMKHYEPGRIVYVVPKKEWADHTHKLALWGSDGSDFFFCADCLVLSRDEKAYWALSEVQRNENVTTVKAKFEERDAEERQRDQQQDAAKEVGTTIVAGTADP